MRRVILIATLLLSLAIPATSLAHKIGTETAGIYATLSYTGSGITISDERLTITESGGKTLYNGPVSSSGCFKACSPTGPRTVRIGWLTPGTSDEDVVLSMFTGGADCCSIVKVYTPSAALGGRYILAASRNFGEDGMQLDGVGKAGTLAFVSADPAFYCRFSACYESGLPLQILEFSGERFINVTKQYPKLIAADGSKWLKLYYKNLYQKTPAQGQGAIAAWAGDEDNLGDAATVRTVLQLQTADGHLKQSFVAQLEHFLATHHYT